MKLLFKQRLFSWFDSYDIYDEAGNTVYVVKGQLAWGHIDGTIMEWDYSILDRSGYSIARVSKELFHMTDTYVIDVQDPGNALDALMFVLAIDAEKCSRN